MIPKSGHRFSEKIMLKAKSATKSKRGPEAGTPLELVARVGFENFCPGYAATPLAGPPG
jgi:hypothetical protein